jgi:hypothetical protein
VIRVRLAMAAARTGAGARAAGVLASLLASSVKMARSAAAAAKPAMAAMAGAVRGLEGSQRVSDPVAARVTKAAHMKVRRTAPNRGTAIREAGGMPRHCQGGAWRIPTWLAVAAATHSRPTSGPVMIRSRARRRDSRAASSGPNPAAIWRGSPNSAVAAAAASSGE